MLAIQLAIAPLGNDSKHDRPCLCYGCECRDRELYVGETGKKNEMRKSVLMGCESLGSLQSSSSFGVQWHPCAIGFSFVHSKMQGKRVAGGPVPLHAIISFIKPIKARSDHDLLARRQQLVHYDGEGTRLSPTPNLPPRPTFSRLPSTALCFESM